MGTNYSMSEHPATPRRGTETQPLEPTSESFKATEAGEFRIYLPKVQHPGGLAPGLNGRVAKITLMKDGLYFLPVGDIAAALEVSESRVRSVLEDGNVLLTRGGQPVAYLRAEGNSGIYFYGEGIDSIYTRENVYWLAEGQGLQMEQMEGEGPDPVNNEDTFLETLHLEQEHWALTALFNDPEADYWLWDSIISGSPALGSKSFTLTSDGAISAGGATLSVHLQGATDTGAKPDHHVIVRLNGTQVGGGQWDGTNGYDLALSFEQALLNDGDNTVEVIGVLDAGVTYSIFYVDSFDLSYHRRYRAEGGVLLSGGESHPVVTIGGFSDAAILLFDVTDPVEPRIVKATTVDVHGSEYRVSFVPETSEALYLAVSMEGLSAPVSVSADVPSDLKASNNRADYVMIVPTELKQAAQALADYRQGQGLETMIVDLEDIYDEFNNGISDPGAIQEFIAYAYQEWDLSPSYVVLVGKGTYDYKDHQGHGDNLVPPILVTTPYHGLFASDNQYVDVSGADGVTEIAIGRLPVVTVEELEGFLAKLIAYEAAGEGAWRGHVLMLADDPDEGGNFPQDSDALLSLLPGQYTSERIYLSEVPIGDARQRLLDGIDQGAVLVNYIGHAGLDRFAQEGLLLTGDVGSMTNGERLPVMTAMTCGMGRYELPGYMTLGEALVLKGDGGTVAVWAPTGLSMNSPARVLEEEWMRAIFEEGETILGEVVVRALEGYAASGEMPYLLDIYNLLGDPATRIKIIPGGS
jgi:hypothetical protein